MEFYEDSSLFNRRQIYFFFAENILEVSLICHELNSVIAHKIFSVLTSKFISVVL